MHGDDYYEDDEHEPCSKKIMPALFAWFLLISTSASYFTLVLPEYINIVGLEHLHLFIGVVVGHGVLFLLVLLNFSVATFMDPGRFPKVDIKDVIEDNGELKCAEVALGFQAWNGWLQIELLVMYENCVIYSE